MIADHRRNVGSFAADLGPGGLAHGIALPPAWQGLFDHRTVHGHLLAHARPLATDVTADHGIRQDAGRTLRLLGSGNPGAGSGDGRGPRQGGTELQQRHRGIVDSAYRRGWRVRVRHLGGDAKQRADQRKETDASHRGDFRQWSDSSASGSSARH